MKMELVWAKGAPWVAELRTVVLNSGSYSGKGTILTI